MTPNPILTSKCAFDTPVSIYLHISNIKSNNYIYVSQQIFCARPASFCKDYEEYFFFIMNLKTTIRKVNNTHKFGSYSENK